MAQDLEKTKRYNCCIDRSIKEETFINPENGEEEIITDVLAINYDRLYMDNIICVQELIKLCRKQQGEIMSLEGRINDLEKILS